MNETGKKIILGVVIVAALVAAGFGASSFFKGEQPVVVKTITLPPGTKSMKQQEKERQERERSGQKVEGGERDLAGSFGG